MWHTARRWIRRLRKPSTPVVGCPRGRAAAEHVSSYLTLRYQGWISVLSTGNWKVSFASFAAWLSIDVIQIRNRWILLGWRWHRKVTSYRWYQQSEMLNTNFVLYKFVVYRGVLFCPNNVKSRQKSHQQYAGRLILCWIVFDASIWTSLIHHQSVMYTYKKWWTMRGREWCLDQSVSIDPWIL